MNKFALFLSLKRKLYLLKNAFHIKGCISLKNLYFLKRGNDDNDIFMSNSTCTCAKCKS